MLSISFIVFLEGLPAGDYVETAISEAAATIAPSIESFVTLFNFEYRHLGGMFVVEVTLVMNNETEADLLSEHVRQGLPIIVDPNVAVRGEIFCVLKSQVHYATVVFDADFSQVEQRSLLVQMYSSLSSSAIGIDHRDVLAITVSEGSVVAVLALRSRIVLDQVQDVTKARLFTIRVGAATDSEVVGRLSSAFSIHTYANFTDDANISTTPRWQDDAVDATPLVESTMLISNKRHSGSYIVTSGVIIFLIVGCYVTFHSHGSDNGTGKKEQHVYPSVTFQTFAGDVDVGDEINDGSADGRTTSLLSNAAIATSDAIVASLTMVGMVPSLEVSKVGGDTARFKTARRKLPATAMTLRRTQSDCHRHPASETGLRLHATSVPVPTGVRQSHTSAAQLPAHSISRRHDNFVNESDIISTVVTALTLRREQRVSQQSQNTNPISILPSTVVESEQFIELDDLPNQFIGNELSVNKERRETRFSPQHQYTNPSSSLPLTFVKSELFTELDDLPNQFIGNELSVCKERRETCFSPQNQRTNPSSSLPSTFVKSEQFTELDDLQNQFIGIELNSNLSSNVSALLDVPSLENTCLSPSQHYLPAVNDLEGSRCTIGVGSEDRLPQERLPGYKERADACIINIGVNDTRRVGLSWARSSVLPDSQATFHVSDGDSHGNESRKAPDSDSVHPCSYVSGFERREEEDPLSKHFYPLQACFSPEVVARRRNQANIHLQGLTGPIQTIEFAFDV
jgi:hypothetical protein